MVNHTGAMADDRPTDSEIKDQLAKILASGEFTNAARLRRFLKYVVEEELAGRADRIKAYSIAVSVLRRSDSFDPQVDPVVRIEAGRLRRALQRYYLASGREDLLRIDIPKGTYVPRFAYQRSRDGGRVSTGEREGIRSRWMHGRRGLASAAALVVIAMLAALLTSWFKSDPVADPQPAPQFASLLMLPLSTADNDRVLGEGLTADILAELSRYTELFIFAPETSFRVGAKSDSRQLAETYGTRYVLQGSLTRDVQALHIGLQLLEASSARILWADSFSIEPTVSRLFAAQAEIAHQVVRQIAEPYGAIGTADLAATRGKPPKSFGAYECVLQAYDYRRRFDMTGYEEVHDCLTRTVRENPTYSDAWTMLALVYVDQTRFSRIHDVPTSTMNLALEAAERAVQLAPASAAARAALISVHFFRQEPEKGFAVGERALELNPNSAEVLFELGLRHVMSGNLDRGLQLVEKASAHNPGAPDAYQLALGLGLFRKGEFEQALETLDRVADRPNFVYWAIASAIFGKAGAKAKAEMARTELLKLYPDFPQSAIDEMRRRSIAPDLVASLVAGWAMAGMEIVRRPNS